MRQILIDDRRPPPRPVPVARIAARAAAFGLGWALGGEAAMAALPGGGSGLVWQLGSLALSAALAALLLWLAVRGGRR